MNTINATLATLVFSFCFACVDHANTAQVSVEINRKLFLIDSLFASLQHSNSINGNVLIAEKGEVIFSKSYGLADEQKNIKLDKHTTFDLASVSKQFTAMGIMQLKKEGKLSLQDKIGQYIPELEFYDGVLIQDLLIHTSGLEDYLELLNKTWDKTKIATNQDVVNAFAQHKPDLLFQPGEDWDYSNTGYAFLATIIERVSNKTYEMFLKEKIFDPLGMRNTFVNLRRFAPKEIKNSAIGYIYSDSLNRKVTPEELDAECVEFFLDGIYGDGMINSTVEDLLLWDRALYTDVLLGEEDKEKVFTDHLLKDSSNTYFGLGWEIDDNKLYGKIALHDGNWSGFATHIERHMDSDKTIIILQNNSTDDTQMPLKELRKILYDLPIRKAIELEKEILQSFAGNYRNEEGSQQELLFAADKLHFVINPDFKLELMPISETETILIGANPEVVLTFFHADDGRINKYQLFQPETGEKSYWIKQ